MKIFELISGKELNGAIVHTLMLVRELAAQGHEVTIACRPGFWLWEQLENLPVRRIDSSMRRTPREVSRMARLIRDSGAEVIHTHMSRAHMFGLIMRMMTGIPCVATAHNRHLQLHWRFNDFVIANSHATCEFQQRYNRVAADKIRTVHCFSDLDRFFAVDETTRRQARRGLGINDDRPLIGVIGEVVRRKGHIHLFRALPEIARRWPNFQLAVVGRFEKHERETRQLRIFQTQNGLFRKVIWVGRRNNVQDFLAAMDVCVVPSIEEPLGLVAIEAQATGTPVIVTDTGGLPEVVQNEQNGLVVPTKNSAAIADGVDRLLSEPKWAAELAANGKKTSAERFHPTRLTREMVEVLEEVAQKRSIRRRAA